MKGSREQGIMGSRTDADVENLLGAGVERAGEPVVAGIDRERCPPEARELLWEAEVACAEPELRTWDRRRARRVSASTKAERLRGIGNHRGEMGCLSGATILFTLSFLEFP